MLLPLSQSRRVRHAESACGARRRAEREDYIRAVIAILSERLAGGRGQGRSHRTAQALLSRFIRKMQEEELNFDQIYDLVAFRIIVGIGARMLRGAGRGPRQLEAGPGPLQRLHRAAQGQYVPVAAHHGDWPARAADGSADPHARDARGGRARNRGALELQGRRRQRAARHRALRVAAAPDRVAAEPQGPAGIPFDCQG